MIKLNAKYKLVILAALLLLGCQKEEIAPKNPTGDSIIFSLSSNAGSSQGYSASTKAADNMMVLKSEDGTDSLIINLTSITETEEITDTSTTKGSPVTDNNIINICEGNIALRAFYNKEQFVNDILVFENDGSARTSNASYWPSDENAMVDFWSYYPKEIDQNQKFSISNSTDSPSLSFYYTLKKDGKEILVDATEQKDLFLAYTRESKGSSSVGLKYTHALSAVKFVAGKALAGEVKNISISNVCAAGTLTYTPKGNEKVNWELDDERYTLDQKFAQDINEDLSGDSSQDITKDINNTIFMLLPQPLEGKVLTIEYRREGETQAKTYTANLPQGNWVAGKAYTYTLTLMDGLGIDATVGTIENKAINGLEIKNAYNKPCYIRVMIIANWVDEDGNVADIIDYQKINIDITTENRNYECDENWSTYWWKEGNVYYYRKPLFKDETTSVKLFDKFTNPVTHEDGLKLDFSVLVQAVEAESTQSSVTSAWSSAIADKLEKLNN
ncbi:MAG: fimbrillin family protein [Peptococcaceae bacterium]|nr:fimbrillin family protein [Peptococcaceae bacterium]